MNISSIPAAMHVESARDMPFNEEQKADLLKEFEAGAGREVSSDLNEGYLLGLATARVLVAEGVWTQQSVIKDAMD